MEDSNKILIAGAFTNETDYVPLPPECIDILNRYIALYPRANEFVKAIIVSDAGSFGKVIKEFVPNGGYTNDEHFMAMGRAIYLDDGKTLVILRSELVNLLIENSKTPFIELTGEQQWWCHPIYHEFGHAEDNARRLEEKPEPKEVPAYKVESYTGHNLRALKSELAACFNCSFLITDECYKEHFKHFQDSVQMMYDECHTVKQTKSIDDIFLTVLKNVWRIFIEFAKLCGYRRGTGGATGTESPTLVHLESLLNSWMDHYPNADFLREESLTRLVVQYALELGFQIVVGPGEFDAIYYSVKTTAASPTF